MKRNILTALAMLLCLFASISAHAQDAKYQAYINKYKDIAIEQMNKYRIPASITLAQGLLESGAGTSELARSSNNHFGIKCHDWDGGRTYKADDTDNDCFRVYKSVRDSYEDHSIFLSTHQRYALLFRLDPTDYVGWARGLKQAGYATSSTYADRLINIIESYNLDRYDNPLNTSYDGTSVVAQGVNIAYPHDTYLANGLVYIIARQGDTLQSIADEFGLSRASLIRYNDLYRNYVPVKGDILYLHRKLLKAKKPHTYHVVGDGESMYMISQMYGVRLRRLYSMNRVNIDSYSPQIGDVIKLR